MAGWGVDEIYVLLTFVNYSIVFFSGDDVYM